MDQHNDSLIEKNKGYMWKLKGKKNRITSKKEFIHCIPSVGRCPSASWKAEPHITAVWEDKCHNQ